jgi:hypothetical protein
MPASDVYRHQARRLRQQYAGRPHVLQYSLRELSRRHDCAQASIRPARKPLAVLPIVADVQRVNATPAKAAPDTAFARAVVDWFADQVARRFAGNLLHHSQRQELLGTAERLGIGRFHANLIIAVAQHQADALPNRTMRMVPSGPRFPFPMIALIAMVQGLIVWGAWRFLHFC